MPIITIFSGAYCHEHPVVQEVIARTGYRQIRDDEIVAEASRRSAIAESKLKRAFSSKTSVFNKFTHEKEHSIAFLKLALAELIPDDNALVTCFYSTSGLEWTNNTNWLTDNDNDDPAASICSWFTNEPSCNQEDRFVTLNLNANGLFDLSLFALLLCRLSECLAV